MDRGDILEKVKIIGSLLAVVPKPLRFVDASFDELM